MTDELTDRHLYQVWDWNGVPYKIRLECPWSDGAHWVYRKEAENCEEGNFPFFGLSEEWVVVEKKIDGYWYAFARNSQRGHTLAPRVGYPSEMLCSSETGG